MKTKLLVLSIVMLFFSCKKTQTIETKILLVSNSGSSGVAKFDLNSGQYLGLFIPKGEGGLIYPDAVTSLDNRSLIVSSGCRTKVDSVCMKELSSILKYDKVSGEFLGTLVSTEASTLLNRPYGTVVGKDGLVYIASLVTNSILRYDKEGKFHDVFAISDGKDSLGLNGPNGLAFDADESHLYVTTEGASFVCDSLGHNCVVEFTGFPSLIKKYDISDGSSEVFSVPSITNPKKSPSLEGIILAPNGKLFVSDFTANLVRVYDSNSGKEERTIKIDIGLACNTTSISNQYLGDMVLDEDGSILLVVGGTSNSDPGGVVKIIASDYEKVDCVIFPTHDLDRPLAVNII